MELGRLVCSVVHGVNEHLDIKVVRSESTTYTSIRKLVTKLEG